MCGLDECNWSWKASSRVNRFGLVGLLRIELQLQVDQLVESHRDPHLIMLDDFEEVLEFYVVSG